MELRTIRFFMVRQLIRASDERQPAGEKSRRARPRSLCHLAASSPLRVGLDRASSCLSRVQPSPFNGRASISSGEWGWLIASNPSNQNIRRGRRTNTDIKLSLRPLTTLMPGSSRWPHEICGICWHFGLMSHVCFKGKPGSQFLCSHSGQRFQSLNVCPAFLDHHTCMQRGRGGASLYSPDPLPVELEVLDRELIAATV
jgi:hypothetical protein